MRKLISVVTGALLFTASFFPAGAFASENPTNQTLNINKLRTELASHTSIPVSPSLENKVLGSLSGQSVPHIGAKDIVAKDGETIYEQEPNDDPFNLGQYDNFPLGDYLIGSIDDYNSSTGNLDYVDYHRIDVTQTQTIFLAGIAEDYYHNLGYVLVDSQGNPISTTQYYTDPDTGELLFEVTPNLEPGTYYVETFDMTGDNTGYEYELYAAPIIPSIPIVNTVREGDGAVTGLADAGDMIHIQDAVQEFTGQVDDNGNFNVVIKPQKTGATLSVKACIDEIETCSTPITVTVQAPADTTAPAAPTVNPIDDNDLAITGTAEYGSIVTIKNGSKVIGTSTANDKTGAFQFKLTHSLAAGTVLSLTATDKAGNVSKPTNVTVLDKTAPAKPSVNPVSDASTNVTGKTEANATVTVSAGSKVLGTKKADIKGAFSIGIAKQKAGTTLNVYATDAAGNKSSNTVVTVLDKTAPAKPSVNPVSDASTSVTGKTEAYATVTVYAGSKVLGSHKADSKGAFSVSIAKQKAGTTLNVYAADAAGNKSPNTVVTVLDKTPPAKPTVYTFGDNATVVSGKTEPGAKVTIAYGKTVLGVSTASSKGDFHVSVKKKQKAGVVLTAYATDKAGNKSAGQTFKVADKTPPGTPTVNKVTTSSTSVSGKAEKGATVYLYSGHHYLGKATVSSKGYYKIGIHKQKKGTNLSVYAKDKAGNKSKTRTVKVV